MNGEELTILRIEFGKIQAKLEERDLTIFNRLNGIDKKLDRQIENHKDNAVDIGKIKEKSNTNRNLFWLLLGGFVTLTFTLLIIIFRVIPIGAIK